MKTSDAIKTLRAAFPLDGISLNEDGLEVYTFQGDFEFHVLTDGADTLQLCAVLALSATGSPALKRRLLEASLFGVETGFGAMATDPLGSGQIAVVDAVPVAELSPDFFKLRVVEFMLYVEYLRSAGLDLIQQDTGGDTFNPQPEDPMHVIRV